jgi:protein-L-isoaspartate(D-aspartate) O-methyltransferase
MSQPRIFYDLMGSCGIFLLSLMGIINLQCNSQGARMDDYGKERAQMVQNQIKQRGIKDQRVLDAMSKVERQKFVPAEYRSEAYNDYPVPIGSGQTISQPYIVAFMTETLGLGENDKVLEVGTGSGYQAAVLAEICDSVFTIEIIPDLGEKAANLLKELGYKNVRVKVGDGYLGWPEHAPFKGIIVTCSPTHVPKPLEEQLAEGGRMIIPVGPVYSQELVLLEKKEGLLIQRDVLPVRFVPMVNEKGNKY